MSTQIRQLTPSAPWNLFADLNAIPRASKKEHAVAKWVLELAQRHGLATATDAFGNVVVKKPASPGRENRPTVVLQGHLDMVHAKNAGVVFDFDTQGIDMYVDGDWVRARGTTLGADNGLGVAAILAVLLADDLEHPPLEALFTLDEEQGLGGAKNLGSGLLQGKILLNLDTEEDHVFTIGCAGGIDTLADWDYAQIPLPAGHKAFQVRIHGLQGGHSGMDINLGRANANKLLARILMAAAPLEARIAQFEGGNLRNEIPREANAVVAVPDVAAFEAVIAAQRQLLQEEFKTTEPNLQVTLSEVPSPEQTMAPEDQAKFLHALRAVHNGVFRMSPEVPGLVEASSNLAKVILANGHLQVASLQRSSVESSKADVAATFRAPFDLLGADIQTVNEYPGWKPAPNSPVVRQMQGIYQALFGHEPVIEACHAGLECGIIGQAYPGLDMVSFGPLIQGAHSPDERASISSFEKFWGFYTSVLAQL